MKTNINDRSYYTMVIVLHYFWFVLQGSFIKKVMPSAGAKVFTFVGSRNHRTTFVYMYTYFGYDFIALLSAKLLKNPHTHI